MPKEKALAGRRAQRHERAIPSEVTMSTKTWKQMITILKELNMTLGGDEGQGTEHRKGNRVVSPVRCREQDKGEGL